AADLQRRGEPFAPAVVLPCEPPTPAKPGAKAPVREGGSGEGGGGGGGARAGLVGGAVAPPRGGRPPPPGPPREGGRGPSRTEGILDFPMTCHSGGTLEIYVDPYLPNPQLVLVGHGPVVEMLETLGRAAGFTVVPLRDDAALAGLGALRLGRRAS